LNVVETTCPQLQKLDVFLCEATKHILELTASPQKRTQQYLDLETAASPKLIHLRHFGFKYHQHNFQLETQKSFLGFIERYWESLTSVVIPVGYNHEARSFILTVCQLLPNLKDLSLAKTNTFPSRGNHGIFDIPFFTTLTNYLASPKFSIERLSTPDMDVSFSPALGQLFQSWSNLKFLQLGDKDISNGPYNNDGRPDFNAYRPVRFCIPHPCVLSPPSSISHFKTITITYHVIPKYAISTDMVDSISQLIL